MKRYSRYIINLLADALFCLAFIFMVGCPGCPPPASTVTPKTDADAAPQSAPRACTPAEAVAVATATDCTGLFVKGKLDGGGGLACVMCPNGSGCQVALGGVYCVVGGCSDPKCGQ